MTDTKYFLFFIALGVVFYVAMTIAINLRLPKLRRKVEKELREGWGVEAPPEDWKPERDEIPDDIAWMASLFPLFEHHMVKDARHMRSQGYTWKYIKTKMAAEIERQNPGLLDRLWRQRERT